MAGAVKIVGISPLGVSGIDGGQRT